VDSAAGCLANDHDSGLGTSLHDWAWTVLEVVLTDGARSDLSEEMGERRCGQGAASRVGSEARSARTMSWAGGLASLADQMERERDEEERTNDVTNSGRKQAQ